MKAFSLWLFKLCWRREIEQVVRHSEIPSIFGTDFDCTYMAAVAYVLETLQLKEPK